MGGGQETPHNFDKTPSRSRASMTSEPSFLDLIFAAVVDACGHPLGGRRFALALRRDCLLDRIRRGVMN
jgi:hypothetical protein